jgi:hypothetical protein
MKKILSIFKVSLFIEIIIGLGAVAAYLFYQPGSWVEAIFIYVCGVIPLSIALKLAIASGRGSRLGENLHITGHIINSIKLLLIVGVIITGIWFFATTIKIVTLAHKWFYGYYASMILVFLLILASSFNFFAYIFISKANKKADPATLHEFW